jgi:AcrR family transcriptional regulator
MRSVSTEVGTDDRTTKARIRDAAIECIAEYGPAGTTTRRVAATAGVSPGLIIHHFGSMDGLCTACDEHVASEIRRIKRSAVTAGIGLDLVRLLEEHDPRPLTAYLAAVLVDDSPAVAELIDDLVADAEGYLREGVEAGTILPADDEHGRAAVLVLWGAGALLLHRHLERLLGTDLLSPGVFADGSVVGYMRPVYEIYSNGLVTPQMGALMRQMIESLTPEGTADGSDPDDQDEGDR